MAIGNKNVNKLILTLIQIGNLAKLRDLRETKLRTGNLECTLN